MELTFLRTCKFVNALLTRWILSIQDYNITMEHCPGRENIAADLVSRQYPGKQWEKERDIIQLTIDALRYKCSIQLRNDLETLQQLQKEEIRINKMIKTIEKKRTCIDLNYMKEYYIEKLQKNHLLTKKKR